MNVYHYRDTVVIHFGRHWGVTIAPRYFRPDAEVLYPGNRYWQALGICIWHDTTPPMTVGERGVW